MKNTIFAIAAAAALGLSTCAYAGNPGNNGGGNGGCGVGQQTNGCGAPDAGPIGGAGGQGGAGGHGGMGGHGLGVGIGSASSNASSNAASSSTSLAAQQQGQLQGQTLNSSNVAHNAAVNEGNTNTVTVHGDSYEAARIPVATAYAPNIAPTASCMGASSAGLQVASFGISGGGSWVSENCEKLEQVRVVSQVLGQTEVAAQMMCSIPGYAAAREAVGQPCDEPVTSKAPAATDEQVASHAAPAAYSGDDPIIRARLGLPPLRN